MMLKWGRKGNYAYACSRVKAKKSLLLTKDNYPKLLMMDANEIGRFLGETQYQEEMTELASRYGGVNLIELGVSRNLARVYSEILGFCTGELQDMISSYLYRWDFWNIKTILRGKFYGATVDEIREDLVPAGELTEDYLNALLAMETNEEVMEAVRKREGLCIPESVMNQYQDTGILQPIEDFLDQVYYHRLLEHIRPKSKPEKLFLSFVRKEIDMMNLRTLLKLKKARIPPERMASFFIDGGNELTLHELTRLSGMEDFEETVDELNPYSFFEDISEGLEEAKDGGSLTHVMREVQRHLIRSSERFSHMHPLSVLPVLDFVLRKKIEVDNIRIIARGRESDMDPDSIRNLLVM